LLILVPNFLHFERVHWHTVTGYTGMLTLVKYLLVLWVPDSIARPPGPGRPAGLLASDSGTGPRIEPNLNHTKALAGLFIAAWQHPCQCLSAWARALAAWWGIQLRRVSFIRLAAAAAMISCLLTGSTSRDQPATQCALRTGV
jgi:hypothetical protein